MIRLLNTYYKINMHLNLFYCNEKLKFMITIYIDIK